MYYSILGTHEFRSSHHSFGIKHQSRSTMAVGWAREGAVQEQIDATIDDGVELARSRLPKGESLAYCEECEQEIPLARREAVPGVRLCVRCQQDLENGQQKAFTFNRQGSKGSQMK